MVAAISTHAYSFEVDGIYYKIVNANSDNEHVEVTYQSFNNKDYSGNVVIPSQVLYSGKKYSVTVIGDDAFFGCSSLRSITIPNSVTEIGSSAFYGCSSLTEITIPNSVTSIGSYTFYGCRSLTEITIPNTVTSIGQDAFFYYI